MIDPSIPGPMEIQELVYLEKLANELPENSEMVEVGTFLGRSAYVLAATRPDCVLTVVDPFDCDIPSWLNGPTMRGDVEIHHGENHFEAFKKYVGNMPNVRVCIDRSPLSKWMLPAPNLVFIDAAHHYEAISADIRYWSQIATSHKALCGHDYSDEFSDVKRAVDEFADANGLSVYVEPETTIWKFV